MDGTANFEVVCGRDIDNDDVRIQLLQYHSLRRHFRDLIEYALGPDYYNMGMDVYECDRLCCEDIKARIKPRRRSRTRRAGFRGMT